VKLFPLKMAKHYLYILLFCLSFALMNLGGVVLAQTKACGPNGLNYTLCVPLPGQKSPTVSGLDQYIAAIFTLALSIAGLLAFMRLLYGGIIYIISSSSVVKKDYAREVMNKSLLGLLLLFAGTLILYFINPDLLYVGRIFSDANRIGITGLDDLKVKRIEEFKATNEAAKIQEEQDRAEWMFRYQKETESLSREKESLSDNLSYLMNSYGQNISSRGSAAERTRLESEIKARNTELLKVHSTLQGIEQEYRLYNNKKDSIIPIEFDISNIRP